MLATKDIRILMWSLNYNVVIPIVYSKSRYSPGLFLTAYLQQELS